MPRKRSKEGIKKRYQRKKQRRREKHTQGNDGTVSPSGIPSNAPPPNLTSARLRVKDLLDTLSRSLPSGPPRRVPPANPLIDALLNALDDTVPSASLPNTPANSAYGRPTV